MLGLGNGFTNVRAHASSARFLQLSMSQTDGTAAPLGLSGSESLFHVLFGVTDEAALFLFTARVVTGLFCSLISRISFYVGVRTFRTFEAALLFRSHLRLQRTTTHNYRSTGSVGITRSAVLRFIFLAIAHSLALQAPPYLQMGLRLHCIPLRFSRRPCLIMRTPSPRMGCVLPAPESRRIDSYRFTHYNLPADRPAVWGYARHHWIDGWMSLLSTP
ncbi:hypothetical protein K469DRAFT_217202 [Zopfia rhizophila CBS 207.26]|uniref:Uncharacterized protein n=1 Tax=Zopfia rhizophila CBS 207.26 TaxID=1314779 RepID=A0A6A6DU82_9PEZI|nr:hypothetical protein K469DRAFT_217202 [Zopfia rhizophila CBS 207.26]